MATRQGLKDLVDLNLPDASEIKAEKHREVEDALIDQMFDNYDSQQTQIDYALARLPVNVGVFRGLEVNATPTGTSLPVEGDCVSAIVTNTIESKVLVTFANEMPSLEYYVVLCVRSRGNYAEDNDILQPTFVNESKTTFSFSINESFPVVQNLDIYFEVKKFNI